MTKDANTKQPPGAANAAGGPGSGLSTPGEIEALADQLKACADALHERILRDIESYTAANKPVPDKVKQQARQLFDEEQLLREQANGLYLDAAKLIVSNLGAPQKHLMALAADAAEKIRKIIRIGDGMGMVARLLGLTAAVATGQAGPILLALEGLRLQMEEIKLHEAQAASA